MSAKSMPLSWWATAGLVSATVVAATVSIATGFSFAAAGGNGNGNGNAGSNQPPGKAVTVTGAVAGTIRIGSPATLNVTVKNPNNQDMSITQVTGTITSVTSAGVAGKPVCDKNWYSVGTFTGSKSLPKNGSAVVSVPLTLNTTTTNQDNCKGSTVQFSFSATAQGA